MIRRLLKSRFARDSATLQASGSLVAVLQLVSTVLVANLIGDSEQGAYFGALALYSLWFLLLNTGVMNATVVQLAAGAEKGDSEQVAAWQAFLVKVYALAGIALLGIGWFLLPWVAEVFLKDRRIGELAWWLTIMPLFELPRVVSQASFQALRRMRDLATIDIANEVARVSSVIGFTWWIGDARGPLVGTVVGCVIGSSVAVWAYRRAARSEGPKLPGPRRILAGVRKVPMARGLALGIRLGYLRTLDALAANVLPMLFIKAAGGMAGIQREAVDAMLAHFRIAQRVIQVPALLLQGISRTTLPALSQMAGRRDAEGFRRAYMRVTAVGGTISITAMTALILAKPLLPFALGLVGFPVEYHEPATRIIVILAVGASALGFQAAFDAFFVVTNTLNVSIWINTLGSAVFIPLLFVMAYTFPGTGAAWTLSIGQWYGMVQLIYILWYFRRGRHHAVFQAMSAKG